jgi:hypothetical protein
LKVEDEEVMVVVKEIKETKVNMMKITKKVNNQK